MNGGRYLNDSSFKSWVPISLGLHSCYASANLVANSKVKEDGTRSGAVFLRVKLEFSRRMSFQV